MVIWWDHRRRKCVCITIGGVIGKGWSHLMSGGCERVFYVFGRRLISAETSVVLMAENNFKPIPSLRKVGLECFVLRKRWTTVYYKLYFSKVVFFGTVVRVQQLQIIFNNNILWLLDSRLITLCKIYPKFHPFAETFRKSLTTWSCVNGLMV